MSEKFVIRVETRFEAAHNLRSYKGAVEPLHGHSWKVEAKFVCPKLDHEDIGIDYVDVEKHLRELGSKFDHRYINDVKPFDELNPTSENIARWFFDSLNRPEIKKNAQLQEVVVWEGPEAHVAYSRS